MYGLILCGLVVLGALSPASALAAGAPVSGARVAIDTAARVASPQRTADRYGVVILQAWQRDAARALKRADPTVVVLAYQNLASMSRADEQGRSATGVSTQRAAGSPDWYLHTSAGRPFTFSGYDWLWAADIGVASYQRAWSDNAIAAIAGSEFDGVFMDDTNLTMRFHHDVADVRPYATDAAYQRATGAAVRAISARVHAAGEQIWANIGAWPMYPATAADWLQDLDGAMDEQFAKWGTVAGVGYNGYWAQQLASLKAAQRARRWYVGVTHSARGDRRGADYGLASMLLGAGGRTAYAFASDYTREQVWPEFFYALGSARGAEVEGADGVHVRRFERGVALVNPTEHARTVTLDGRYGGSGRHCAQRIRLGPHRGLVLRPCATPAE
jgi:hypothetical protein